MKHKIKKAGSYKWKATKKKKTSAKKPKQIRTKGTGPRLTPEEDEAQ